MFYWKNVELNVFVSLFVATYFAMILWALMWDKPRFILMPIIWTICLAIGYGVTIKTLVTSPTSDNLHKV